MKRFAAKLTFVHRTLWQNDRAYRWAVLLGQPPVLGIGLAAAVLVLLRLVVTPPHDPTTPEAGRKVLSAFAPVSRSRRKLGSVWNHSSRGRTGCSASSAGRTRSASVPSAPPRASAGSAAACGKQFNERACTVLNRAQYPSDVVALVVLWGLRYKLSPRDLPEMFAVLGMVLSHEAVREWAAKLTPALAEELRRVRRGRVGRSWYVDETYLKIAGRWCYVYRAIDRSGALVDVLFSERRDMKAARVFFRSATATTGVTPDRVTTDGHHSYPRAIRTELGKAVRHRTSRYLNNGLEQDHRGLK